MRKKYQVVAFIRINPEDPVEPLTYNEALKEKEQLELMQSENIYKIEGVESGEEIEIRDEIRLTAFVRNNKVLFPYQNEVENIALDTVGTHDNIYFDETPITDRFSVKYNREENAWELV